jgi:hypothetical protein
MQDLNNDDYFQRTHLLHDYSKYGNAFCSLDGFLLISRKRDFIYLHTAETDKLRRKLYSQLATPIPRRVRRDTVKRPTATNLKVGAK